MQFFSLVQRLVEKQNHSLPLPEHPTKSNGSSLKSTYGNLWEYTEGCLPDYPCRLHWTGWYNVTNLSDIVHILKGQHHWGPAQVNLTWVNFIHYVICTMKQEKTSTKLIPVSISNGHQEVTTPIVFITTMTIMHALYGCPRCTHHIAIRMYMQQSSDSNSN